MHAPFPPLLFAAGLLAAACVPEDAAVPVDEPLFPTGMAVSGDRLLVVSSDFDLAQGAGALLSADLALVRSVTAPAGADDIAKGAYVDAAILPSFGDRPVVTAGGERVYVPTRAENRVVVLDVAGNGGLSCPESTPADGAGTPVCGQSTSAIQLPVNDPFEIVLLDEVREDAPAGELGALLRVDGLIMLQSSPVVFFFTDDARREGAQRLQVSANLDLGEIFGGVRSGLLRPETNGTDAVVIAAVDLARDLNLVGGRIVLFAPDGGAFGDDGVSEGELKSFDVTLVTGSLSLRDMVLVPGEDGDNDAIVAVLREPDALARFEIDDVGGLPDLRLTHVASTCRAPTALARARVSFGAAPGDDVRDRLLLTCHEGDVVEAIDPLTLRTTDAVRFTGRGPYDVVVHEAPADAANAGELEVFVSFFLDGSVGALRFVGGRLEATGRIGEPDPRPEDGRE